MVRELHKDVHKHIELKNAKAAAKANKGRKKLNLKEGDLVWVYLRKERFPTLRKSKLSPRADGPFPILRKINDNAYLLDLQGKYNVSPVFNISDLSPCVLSDSRTNLFEGGGDDANPAPLLDELESSEESNHMSNMEGPLTRGRLRKLQEELQTHLGIFAATESKAQLHTYSVLSIQVGADQANFGHIIQGHLSHDQVTFPPHFSTC